MITREMTIEDIFKKFPHKSQKLAQEMTNAGLQCAGCCASTWETVEQGMYGHGFSDEKIERLLGKLNAILKEEEDLTTISFTKRAADKFLGILTEEGKEGWGVRLGEKAAGCSGFEFFLDYSEKPKIDDRVFTSNGIQIHVSGQSVNRLLGTSVDYVDGLQGAGFKITNPNVKSSCGCGTSHGY